MNEKKKSHIFNLTLAAMFLAVGLILPFLTGQIPQIGNKLLPMHIPVLLCGLICGWKYGLAVGFILTLLRYFLFGMPVLFPTGIAMAFELCTYGFTVGLLYSRSHWKCVVALYRSMIIAMIASANVKSTYRKYQQIGNSRGLTGQMAARQILDANGLYNVSIEHISGELSDHYDPRANVVRLSDSTFNSTSVAAVGVAAHEVGHAVQYATGYSPMKLRSAVIPLTNIGSTLSYPMVILGLVLGNSYVGDMLINAGIFLFLAVVLFQFATLFVEFNASARAMKTLDSQHILEGNELSMSRKVLTAAALTYVAALFTAIVNLLRLILIASGRNRRR